MTRMRFRTDSDMIADEKAAGTPFDRFRDSRWPTREQWDATPPAQPGDTWRITWALTVEDKAAGKTIGPVAGYAICCPKCRRVHRWTGAINCAPVPGSKYCPHNGRGSCWAWSGVAEQNTLSASPSLHAVNACGWHGFLTNGVLSGA